MNTRLVFWFAAIVLIVASVGKVLLLAQTPAPILLLDSRLLTTLLIEFEIALAGFLATGLMMRTTQIVSLLTFIVFATVSLYLALKGNANCGCLGVIALNPWIMLVVDTFVVVSLLSLNVC